MLSILSSCVGLSWRTVLVAFIVTVVVSEIQSKGSDTKAGVQKWRSDLGHFKSYADALPLRNKRDTAIVIKDANLKDDWKELPSKGFNVSVNLEWLSTLSLNLCPLADFCHVESTEPTYDIFESCCKSCYCNETCGSTLNCCLEQFDLYKEVETSNLQCVRPVISYVNMSSRIKVPDYYMVTECLDDLNNKCMQKPVAKWGPFFPAYSKTEDKLFFNRHCAECNNATDAEEWMLSLTCNFVSDHQLTLMDNLIEDALKGISCEIVFVPQKDIPVSKFTCVKDPVSHCNVTGEWIDFDPIINEACENIYAPVRSDQNPDFLYANIFCVICNNATYNPNSVCLQSEHQVKDPSFTTFSVLLDYKVVDSLEGKEAERKSQKTCGELEIKHPSKDECRTILCPTGQLRTSEGCKIYTASLYTRGYQLYLHLQPIYRAGGMLTLSDLLALTPGEVKLSFYGAKLPVDYWLMYAEIETASDNKEYAKSLSVNIASGEYPVNVTRALETVNYALNHNVTFIVQRKLDTTAFSFKVKFARQIGPHVSEFGEKGNYTYISSLGSMLSPLIISKLYFCKQVRLWPGEWRYVDERKVSIEISLGSGNISVLQALEFSRHTTEKGNEYVQICVDDFNPNPENYIGNVAVPVPYNVPLTPLYLICYLFLRKCALGI